MSTCVLTVIFQSGLLWTYPRNIYIGDNSDEVEEIKWLRDNPNVVDDIGLIHQVKFFYPPNLTHVYTLNLPKYNLNKEIEFIREKDIMS